MKPEKTANASRYALLLNGSRFACAVLRVLLGNDRAPALLVLPEYAPAAVGESLVHSQSDSPLQQLAGAIELDYAPRKQQNKLADRLRRQRFDYLLVACWPYLIDSEVTSSVSRYALNLHPSLLPAYRGPDPIAEQLACGESRLGVSLHLLNQHFDRGDILAQALLPGNTPPSDRITFENQCATLGASMFSAILDDPDSVGTALPQGHLQHP